MPSSPLSPRLVTWLIAALLAASLIYLQVLGYEKDAFGSLVAYSVIALSAILAASFLRPIWNPDRTCFYSAAVFVSCISLRALTSPSPYTARADFLAILAASLVYLLTTGVLSAPTIRKALMCVLLAFVIVHVLVSLVQAGFGANLMVVSSLELVPPSARGTGLYANPDHLAGLLEVIGALGLCLACWSRWPRPIKVILGYLTAISYFGLIFTASRGGYLSAIASLLLFAALSLMALRAAGTASLLKIGAAGLGLALLLVLSITFALHQSPALKSAADNLFSIDSGRLGLWNAALQQWHLQPLIGTGSGTYLFYGRQFRSELMQLDPIDAHNDYLQLLAEYGLLGFIAFLIFLFVHLRHALKAYLLLGPRRIAAGSILCSDRFSLNLAALCALAASLVHAFVDFNQHIPANAMLSALIFGFLADSGLPAPNQRQSLGSYRLLLALLALVLLCQSLRFIPAEYYSKQAFFALQDEAPEAALACATHAVNFDSHNPIAYSRLGRARFASANRETDAAKHAQLTMEGLAALQKAQQLVPLDGNYALELGLRYDHFGRFEEAEKMFQLALERDPRSENVKQMYSFHLENWKTSK